jgi:hypothetical protein
MSKITIDAAVVQQALEHVEWINSRQTGGEIQMRARLAALDLRAAIEQAESVPPEFYGSEPWEYPNPEHILRQRQVIAY